MLYFLLVMLVLAAAFVAVLPRWPYSKEWSTFPAKAIAAAAAIIVLAWLLGLLEFGEPEAPEEIPAATATE